MIFTPADHRPADVYRLMTGLIVPRPIAFVSSTDAAGVNNLAPFSFFTAVSANPPVICFSPMVRGRDGTLKDTLQNIEAMHEFVVNIVSEPLAQKMNACSAEVSADVDEFVLSGLTPIASERVRPPRVREALASMECRLVQAVHVSRLPLGGSLVLGEVLLFHVDDHLLDGCTVNPDVLQPIGRMGGSIYTRTTDRFLMDRPSTPSPQGTIPDESGRSGK